MIRRRIALIAEKFGDEIDEGDTTFFSFPEPSRISCSGGSSALAECRLGYRMPYVFDTARDVAAQKNWAKDVAALPYEEARRADHEILRYRPKGGGLRPALCVPEVRGIPG